MENLTIEQRLDRIEQLLIGTKKVLNFDEASKYLQLSKSHLYKMTSTCKIPHYKPNGKRIYFNTEELEKWLLSNRITTVDEIEEEANNYLLTHKKKF
jgi:excisionase family DNA binding protein